jgi:hypothetical protein
MLVEYIGSDKKRFSALMGCFFSGEEPLVQRAAWIMSEVALRYNDLIFPYLDKIIRLLGTPRQNNAVERNAVRIFQAIEIPARHQGKIMKICFDYIQSAHAPPAVKAHSLKTLQNLSKIYPDIKSELLLIINERWQLESPAFKSRAKKILED